VPTQRQRADPAGFPLAPVTTTNVVVRPAPVRACAIALPPARVSPPAVTPNVAARNAVRLECRVFVMTPREPRRAALV
jgi:hypothetical protein